MIAFLVLLNIWGVISVDTERFEEIVSLDRVKEFFTVDEKANDPADSSPVDETADDPETDDGTGIDIIIEDSNDQPRTLDTTIRAATYSITDLADAVAFDNAAKTCLHAGLDTVILDVKPDIGTAMGTQEEVDRIQYLVDAFKGRGLRVAARVSCFRDGTYPRENAGTGIVTQSGKSWLDWQYTAWISPNSTQGCDYILSQITIAADFGVDEVILDNLCFPQAGKTGYIAYSSDKSLESTITSFVAKIAKLADNYPQTLFSAICGYDPTLDAGYGAGGQDIDGFYRVFDRIFVYPSDARRYTFEPDVYTAAVEHFGSNDDRRVVAIMQSEQLSSLDYMFQSMFASGSDNFVAILTGGGYDSAIFPPNK